MFSVIFLLNGLYLLIVGIIIVIIATLCGLLLKLLTHFDGQFNTQWALHLNTQDRRFVRVVTIHPRIKSVEKLVKILKWFGYRLVNNTELVCLISVPDCPRDVHGYDDLSGDYIKISSFINDPRQTKVIERSSVPFKIIGDVTLIGVTRIDRSVRQPILTHLDQAAAP